MSTVVIAGGFVTVKRAANYTLVGYALGSAMIQLITKGRTEDDKGNG